MEQNLYSHTLLIIVRCPTSPAQAPTAVCIPLLPLLASHFSLFLIDSRAAPNPPSFVQFPPPLPYNPYTICPRVECSFLQNHKRSVCRLFSRAPLSLSSLYRCLFLCRFRICSYTARGSVSRGLRQPSSWPPIAQHTPQFYPPS